MPVITAHRAGAALAQENSLAAFERSIAAGARSAEIDLQLTRDGVPVVLHDATLKRSTCFAQPVHALDRARLPRLIDGEPLPTLEMFLEAARGRAELTLELKDYGHSAPLPTAVLRVLKRTQSLDGVQICSFSPALLATLRGLRRRPRLGLVLDRLDRLRFARGLEFVSLAHRLLTPGLMTRLHMQGLAVHAWTVNGDRAIKRAARLGVDFLITDDPVAALAALDAASAEPRERRADAAAPL